MYLLTAVVVIGAVTFALRAAPFLALHRFAGLPLVRHLGASMPAGIMVILVLYSLRSVSLTTYPYGAPALVAVGATVLLHLWRRNALVSIAGGTALYVAVLAAFG
jgi:branched-subunit amino acid transport protein AzlD